MNESWTRIPSGANIFVVWDAIDNKPISTKWDDLVATIWDTGATKFDGGSTVFDLEGLLPTTWID